MNDGESLYHSLANPECTRLLLAAGAQIKRTNTTNNRAAWGSLEALRLLLQHGSDPNERSPSSGLSVWGSPLMYAIRWRRPAVFVRVLLNAGADPRATTARGVIAYRVAMQFGLDWNVTALNLAVFRGNASLTRFLLAHVASWLERHGYNDDVRGEPVPGGDWIGCAEALLEAGMPRAEPPRPERTVAGPSWVLIDGHPKWFRRRSPRSCWATPARSPDGPHAKASEILAMW